MYTQNDTKLMNIDKSHDHMITQKTVMHVIQPGHVCTVHDVH